MHYDIISSKAIKEHLANTRFLNIRQARRAYLNLDSQNGFSYAQTIIEELKSITSQAPELAPFGWDVFAQKLEANRRDAQVTLYVYYSCY